MLVAADLNHAALIGWQDLQKLHVIPASFPAVAAVAQCYVNLKTKTLETFPSVFSDTLDNKPMCAQEMQILCNQLAFFIPDFQHHTVALRQLTGKGRSFLWLPEHQFEFDKLKNILSSDLIVWHFDHKRQVYCCCLLYTSPSPRDRQKSRMPSSA